MCARCCTRCKWLVIISWFESGHACLCNVQDPQSPSSLEIGNLALQRKCTSTKRIRFNLYEMYFVLNRTQSRLSSISFATHRFCNTCVMEGGVDDILFIRRPWSWTVATTSRLLGLDVSPTICILWLEFRGQVDTSTSSLEQNNSAVSALNRLLATKIVHRRLLQKSVFAPPPSIFRAAAPCLWI